MDKFSYNSYPDSAESSPRSRDVEFENPSPWEDQQQQQYQGMGQPVSGMTDLRTGPDGKVAVNMAAPQVSDSV
uniref:At5g09620 n=1 Tax=Arabidopsis thaliana TaxID=3702 RepID=Q6NNN4_ARATH|nr:At5g09620 [Arabidopsis thaliana]